MTVKLSWFMGLVLACLFMPDMSSSVVNPQPGMVLVKGGTFTIGANEEEGDGAPIHDVTLDGFYIGRFEVTQAEWQAVMGDNPSFYPAAGNPVENVDWYMAVAFCNKKSEQEGLMPCYSGQGDNITCNFAASSYRLPTEAEWEYAARGGSRSGGYTYSGSNSAEEVAWFEDDSGGRPRPKGQKKPNELGIYDMSGNAWEWCWEWYDPGYYKNGPANNPPGPLTGKERSYRGGGCCGRQEFLRPAARFKLPPAYKHFDMGLRVIKKGVGPVPENMVAVAGGTFSMGNREGVRGYGPAHPVKVDSFYMAVCELTQEEWTAVMGYNPSEHVTAHSPVDGVRFLEAVEYCNRRSRLEGLAPCYSGTGETIACDFSANGYRLPTEAEWEYAARGGSRSGDYTYSGSNNAEEVAWYDKNAVNGWTSPVGEKKPNELGLFDMTGNAWEWCWDRYDKYYYRNSPVDNPRGPDQGARRVVRGGSIDYPPLRPISRIGIRLFQLYPNFGLRLVRTAR